MRTCRLQRRIGCAANLRPIVKGSRRASGDNIQGDGCADAHITSVRPIACRLGGSRHRGEVRRFDVKVAANQRNGGACANAGRALKIHIVKRERARDPDIRAVAARTRGSAGGKQVFARLTDTQGRDRQRPGPQRLIGLRYGRGLRDVKRQAHPDARGASRGLPIGEHA